MKGRDRSDSQSQAQDDMDNVNPQYLIRDNLYIQKFSCIRSF